MVHGVRVGIQQSKGGVHAFDGIMQSLEYIRQLCQTVNRGSDLLENNAIMFPRTERLDDSNFAIRAPLQFCKTHRYCGCDSSPKRSLIQV